jgi:hypothetical protein
VKNESGAISMWDEMLRRGGKPLTIRSDLILIRVYPRDPR